MAEKFRGSPGAMQREAFEAIIRHEQQRPYSNLIGSRNAQLIRTVAGSVDSLMKDCGIGGRQRHIVLDAVWANFRMALSYVGMPVKRRDARIADAVVLNVGFAMESAGIRGAKRSLILGAIEKHAKGAEKYIRKEEARLLLRH